MRLGDAVFAAQVAVRAHGKGSAVFVTEPAGNCRDVHAGFNTDGREEMPQIVMRDSCHSNFLGSASHGFFAILHSEYFRAGRFAISPFPHSQN